MLPDKLSLIRIHKAQFNCHIINANHMPRIITEIKNSHVDDNVANFNRHVIYAKCRLRKKQKREKQRKCDRNASKQTYKINTNKKKNCSTLGVIYKEHKWIPYTRKSPSNFWVQHVPINLVNLLKITLLIL